MRKRLLSFALAAISAATASAQPMMVYEAGVTEGTYTPETTLTDIAFTYTGTELNEKVFAADNAVAESGVFTKGLPIGFDFKFNSKWMNQVLIASNGYIIMGRDSVMVADPSNWYFVLSAVNQPNTAGVIFRSAAAATENTKISYGIVGTSPNRQFVVQYSNIELGVDGWSGYSARDTVSLQIRLHETTGRLEFITNGYEPCQAVSEDMGWNDMFKIGVHGTDKDYLTKGGTYADEVFNAKENSLNWRIDEFPADGTTYWFLPPADCEAPTTGATDLNTSATSLAVSGEFTPSNAADHYIVLVGESAQLEVMPERRE